MYPVRLNRSLNSKKTPSVLNNHELRAKHPASRPGSLPATRMPLPGVPEPTPQEITDSRGRGPAEKVDEHNTPPNVLGRWPKGLRRMHCRRRREKAPHDSRCSPSRTVAALFSADSDRIQRNWLEAARLTMKCIMEHDGYMRKYRMSNGQCGDVRRVERGRYLNGDTPELDQRRVYSQFE